VPTGHRCPSARTAITMVALALTLLVSGCAESAHDKKVRADAAVDAALKLQSAGQEDSARDKYRRAIAARPASANAHFNLALLLRHVGKTAEGAAHMSKALTLNPKLTDPAAKVTRRGPSSTVAPAPKR